MSNFKRYYSNGNTVFITMVTYDRKNILVDNIELLRIALQSVKYKHNIIAGVVLHNHLHLIMQIENSHEVSKIITSFKTNFSRMLPFNYTQTEKQIERREKGIWQRKYYDHIIRNEEDFNRHLDYIHYNPMKHYNISPKDWPYSSFKKFVEQGYYESEWCNFEDKYNIAALDLE